MPKANWERAGRHVLFANAAVAHGSAPTSVVRERGSTPLWLVFYPNSASRASEVRTVLEPWAAQQGLPCIFETDGYLALGIAVVPNAEQDAVVGSIVDCLGRVGVELSQLPAKSEPDIRLDEPTGNP